MGIRDANTYDIISSMIKNPKLISVLCGQFGDLGKLPKESNFFMHASIVNHYLEGGWYPRGGSSIIANSIIPIIEKSGGRVLVGKKVDRIILEKNRAIGVIMENDDIIKKQHSHNSELLMFMEQMNFGPFLRRQLIEIAQQ